MEALLLFAERDGPPMFARIDANALAALGRDKFRGAGLIPADFIVWLIFLGVFDFLSNRFYVVKPLF
jgi:hypothetical protein